MYLNSFHQLVILVLLFASLISGGLLLVVKDEDIGTNA